MVENIKVRPDIEVLALEHENELKKPVESRKVTRLQKFVLALKGIQSLSPSNHNSFYWLASYHGASSPEIYAEQRRLVGSQAPRGFFCAHGIQEFPAWHRVYLFLYEKALQQIDPDVMLPYWNQFSQSSKEKGLSRIFTRRKIDLVDGSSISNPLRRYTLQDKVDTYPAGTTTSREDDQLSTYLSSEHPTYVKRALENKDYDSFSNHSSSNWSLESAHDNVHVYIGGFMGDPTTAAFDPIFWLHHCYIDYLFWVWQVENGQTNKLNTNRGSYKLIPFKKSEKLFYTVDDTANLSNFSYNYPEFDVKIVGMESRNARKQFSNLRSIPHLHKDENSKRELRIEGIEFSKFGGSFRIKAYAFPPTGKVYLGVFTVFRASENCQNCDVRKTLAAGFRLKSVKEEHEGNLEFKIKFELKDKIEFQFRVKMNPGVRYVERRFGNTFELRY